MVSQSWRGDIVECGGSLPLLRWQLKLPIDRWGAESSAGEGVSQCGVTILPLRWWRWAAALGGAVGSAKAGASSRTPNARLPGWKCRRADISNVSPGARHPRGHGPRFPLPLFANHCDTSLRMVSK
jgi:hypothetical protein